MIILYSKLKVKHYDLTIYNKFMYLFFLCMLPVFHVFRVSKLLFVIYTSRL